MYSQQYSVVLLLGDKEHGIVIIASNLYSKAKLVRY